MIIFLKGRIYMNLSNIISWTISGVLLAVNILQFSFLRKDKKSSIIKDMQEKIASLERKVEDYEDFNKHYVRVEEACYGKNVDGTPNLNDGPYCFNCAQIHHKPQVLVNRFSGHGDCINCKTRLLYNKRESDQSDRQLDIENQHRSEMFNDLFKY